MIDTSIHVSHSYDSIVHIVILRLRLERPKIARGLMSSVVLFELHQRRGIHIRFAASFIRNRVLSMWSNRVFPVASPTSRRRRDPAFVCTRLPNPPGPLTFSPPDGIIDFGEGRGAKTPKLFAERPYASLDYRTFPFVCIPISSRALSIRKTHTGDQRSSLNIFILF